MYFGDEIEFGTELGVHSIFVLQKVFITAKSTQNTKSFSKTDYQAQNLAGRTFSSVL